MEVWYLIWFIAEGRQAGQYFVGGEYQTQELCEAGYRRQRRHWRRVYGHNLEWLCTLEERNWHETVPNTTQGPR